MSDGNDEAASDDNAGSVNADNSEAASDGNAAVTAEEESATQQSIPSEPNDSLVPGKAKRERRAEEEDTEQRPIPAEPGHSFVPGKARKARSEGMEERESRQHNRITLIRILLEVVLILATAALIYATVKLAIVTSELAAVTKEEARNGKSSAKPAKERTQEANPNPSHLKEKIQNLNKFLHIIKPIIGSNFNCSVSQNGERWTLHEAELCYDLKIPIQNSDKLDPQAQVWIEFTHNGRSWKCPPAEHDDSGESMTTNLVSCFLDNQQERKGDIDFVIKPNQQEER